MDQPNCAYQLYLLNINDQLKSWSVTHSIPNDHCNHAPWPTTLAFPPTGHPRGTHVTFPPTDVAKSSFLIGAAPTNLNVHRPHQPSRLLRFPPVSPSLPLSPCIAERQAYCSWQSNLQEQKQQDSASLRSRQCNSEVWERSFSWLQIPI